MRNNILAISLFFFVTTLFFSSCSSPLDWPESPLYDLEDGEPSKWKASEIEKVKEEIVGHYAHFDVVAYEDTTTKTTMRTFIISYGYTDIYIEDGRLMQADRFVHAEQKLSRKGATSFFSDEAVQAIKPRVQEIDLFYEDDEWHIFRPSTPTLLGVEGDPSKALVTPLDEKIITDPDGDGHPGVTVKLSVGKYFEGEIYIVRREIFTNFLTLNNDGSLVGHVVDESEQFVVGASKKILTQESNSIQHPDMGLSPLLLIPVDSEIDTPEELMKMRDELFPDEPDFLQNKKNSK